MPGERSQKSWVRAHRKSYWAVLGEALTGKKKEDKPKKKSNDERHSSHGSGGFESHRSLGPDDDDEPHFPGEDDVSEMGWVPPHYSGMAGPAAAPQGANQQAGHRQPSALAPPSNRRQLRPGELNRHLQPGGQTARGERMRGVEESRYIGSEMPGRSGRSGEARQASGGSRQPVHPWKAETERYEQEKTRQKRRDGE